MKQIEWIQCISCILLHSKCDGVRDKHLERCCRKISNYLVKLSSDMHTAYAIPAGVSVAHFRILKWKLIWTFILSQNTAACGSHAVGVSNFRSNVWIRMWMDNFQLMILADTQWIDKAQCCNKSTTGMKCCGLRAQYCGRHTCQTLKRLRLNETECDGVIEWGWVNE